MKAKVAIVVMMLLMVGSVAFGAAIDGQWRGEYDPGLLPGAKPMILEYTFKAEGNTLTGTNKPGGEYSARIEPTPIKNGKISGNKISFSLPMPGEPDRSFDYTGELSGDQIKLKFTLTGGSVGEFTLFRVKK